jgi:hypothetical protein
LVRGKAKIDTSKVHLGMTCMCLSGYSMLPFISEDDIFKFSLTVGVTLIFTSRLTCIITEVTIILKYNIVAFIDGVILSYALFFSLILPSSA